MTIWVRFGEAPEGGQSRNDETDQLELGVSCYRANLNHDGDVLDLIVPDEASATTALRLFDDRPVYLVEGEQVGTGGDGEPVIAVTSCALLPDVEVVNYSTDD